MGDYKAAEPGPGEALGAPTTPELMDEIWREIDLELGAISPRARLSPPPGLVELCAIPSPVRLSFQKDQTHQSAGPRDSWDLGGLSELDCKILSVGGSTEAIERTRARLEANKKDRESPEQLIVSLQRQFGHLREENRYLQGLRAAYLRLQREVQEAYHNIEAARDEVRRGQTLVRNGRQNVEKGLTQIQVAIRQSQQIASASEETLIGYWIRGAGSESKPF